MESKPHSSTMGSSGLPVQHLCDQMLGDVPQDRSPKLRSSHSSQISGRTQSEVKSARQSAATTFTEGVAPIDHGNGPDEQCVNILSFLDTIHPAECYRVYNWLTPIYVIRQTISTDHQDLVHVGAWATDLPRDDIPSIDHDPFLSSNDDGIGKNGASLASG